MRREDLSKEESIENLGYVVCSRGNRRDLQRQGFVPSENKLVGNAIVEVGGSFRSLVSGEIVHW